MAIVDRKLCIICGCPDECEHEDKGNLAVLSCRDFKPDPAKEGLDSVVQIQS